jgi:hypothetical protein
VLVQRCVADKTRPQVRSVMERLWGLVKCAAANQYHYYYHYHYHLRYSPLSPSPSPSLYLLLCAGSALVTGYDHQQPRDPKAGIAAAGEAWAGKCNKYMNPEYADWCPACVQHVDV